MSHWHTERRSVVFGICGMICLIAGPALGDENRFDGEYIGTRTLVEGGSENANCPATDDVTVTIKGETLTFTNSALKKYTMAFDPNKDGSFQDVSIDVDGGTVDIHGRVVGDVIDADVNNPPCEHHWHLKKK